MGAAQAGWHASGHPGACALAVQSCSCLPSGSLQEYGSDSPSRRAEEIGVPASEFESEASSCERDCGSDDTSEGRPSEREARLELKRHRVFSSHLRSKFHDHYRIIHLLGEGSYGNVYEAATLQSASSSGAESPETEEVEQRRVAVKCFSLARTGPIREGETEAAAQGRFAREVASRRASFERERALLSKLEHPHIIKMFECFEERERLWIVLELCSGGELYECVAERVRQGSGAGLEEDMARTFFRQMLHAVSYLHANLVVHRDVKTENFLLLSPPGSGGGDFVKLCDFGTAVKLTEAQPRAMERIGTLSYTAPEVYARYGATVLADMWSLGVVLYVLLVGASPFRITGEEPRQDTIDRIAQGRFDTSRTAWLGLSESARDLVHRQLVVDERLRLRGAGALRHPWVEPGNPPLPPLQPVNPGMAMAEVVVASPRRFLSPRASREEHLSDYAQYAHGVLTLVGRFARLDPLQQLVVTVCAQMMSEAELRTLATSLPWYELFFALDLDEDGRVGLEEFASGIKAMLGSSCMYTDDHLISLAQALDVDRSGAVDWIEWVAVAVLSAESVLEQPEPMRTAFRVLDRPSSDGVVGVADLFAVASVGGTSGECDTSVHARVVVCRTLGRWASAQSTSSNTKRGQARGHVPRKRRRGKAAAPPSLTLSDLHRMMLAASNGLEHLESNSGCGSSGGGWFACCQSEFSPSSLVLVQQHKALPRLKPRDDASDAS